MNLIKNKKYQQKGMSQLPIILGLLILGIALPAAINLVQQRQETRKAAVSDCNQPCSDDSQCGSGLVCYKEGCSSDRDCMWCGQDCVPRNTGVYCPDVMPPEGEDCVCGPDGNCQTVSGGVVMGESDQLAQELIETTDFEREIISSSGVCRNPDCLTDTDCICGEEPTSTPAPPVDPTPTPAPPVDPTNTPASGGENVPECTNLSVNSVISEDKTLVKATASDEDGDLKEVTFAYAEYKENATESYYCDSNNWTVIDTDNNGSDGWEAEWDVSGVSQGKYYVVANVYDEMDNWCTGNPVGTCNNATAECSNCNRVVSIVSESLSWDIETAAVCEDGSIADIEVSTWYVAWPPNPFEPVLEDSRIGAKMTTIISTDERNGLYVGLCEREKCENDEFLQLRGNPPHSAITYGEYWNPYIPNARWSRSELPEGSYLIEFEAPDSACVEDDRMPDLTISSISYSPSNPQPGDEVSITAEIKNIGQMATRDFTTYLYIDPEQQPPTQATPETSYYGHHVWLIPDKKFDWSYDYVFDEAGEHDVYVWVDREDQIEEVNEENNLLSQKIVVGGGEERCKPCPDGSFAPVRTSSFNCDTDGKQNVDYGRWAQQYSKVKLDGQRVDKDELYGDYDCDGDITVSDHQIWYARWCPTEHSNCD